jgi:hypothetical protein
VKVESELQVSSRKVRGCIGLGVTDEILQRMTLRLMLTFLKSRMLRETGIIECRLNAVEPSIRSVVSMVIGEASDSHMFLLHICILGYSRFSACQRCGDTLAAVNVWFVAKTAPPLARSQTRLCRFVLICYCIP